MVFTRKDGISMGYVSFREGIIPQVYGHTSKFRKILDFIYIHIANDQLNQQTTTISTLLNNKQSPPQPPTPETTRFPPCHLLAGADDTGVSHHIRVIRVTEEFKGLDPFLKTRVEGNHESCRHGTRVLPWFWTDSWGYFVWRKWSENGEWALMLVQIVAWCWVKVDSLYVRWFIEYLIQTWVF